MNQKHKDQDMPNRQSNMEKAEGSRESVLDDSDSFEQGAGRSEMTRGMGSSEKRSQSGDKATGISNRGLEREQDEQSHLPERGESGSER